MNLIVVMLCYFYPCKTYVSDILRTFLRVTPYSGDK